MSLRYWWHYRTWWGQIRYLKALLDHRTAQVDQLQKLCAQYEEFGALMQGRTRMPTPRGDQDAD